MRLICLCLAVLSAAALAEPELGKPFAVLEGRCRLQPGTSVQLSGRSSFDTDGEIVAWEFQLDGQPVASEDGLVTLRFDAPGVHFLELIVTDNEGRRAQVRQPVFVESRGALLQRRLLSRERRGAVMLLCELQDAETSDAIETLGEQIFAPVMGMAYGEVEIIRGERALPEPFFEAIRQVAARRDVVDIFLFAHGSPDHLWFKNRRSATGEDILRELEGRGGEKVRMVYSTLCWGESMNQAWRKVGAQAASGAVDVHIPIEAPPFILGWLAGQEYGSLTARCFELNRDAHDLRNQLALSLEPSLRMLQDNLGTSDPERAIDYYLDWFLRDGEWEIWKSTPLIEGGGVTIDTFPEDLAPALPSS